MSKKIKKAAIIVLIVLLSFILLVFLIIEIDLIKNKYTGFSDITNVIKINCGSDYEVISTTGSGDDVEQIVMAKNMEEFEDFLKENGCEKKTQAGAGAVYVSANGKKFVAIRSYRMSLSVYVIFTIMHATMDEIIR